MTRARRWLRRGVLVVCAAALAVVVAEVALRVAGLGEKGSVAQLYVADETLGWRHATDATVRQVDREFDVTWQLDARGLRRAAPLGDGPRILALGDSHTAGHGVETQQAWPARLEARLAERHPGATVLNAGVNGYGAAQQWLALEAALGEGDLDGVIVASFLGNDLRELVEGVGIRGFRRPVLDDGLTVTNPPASSTSADVGLVDATKAWLAERSRLYVVVGGLARDGPLRDAFAALGLMDPRASGPPHARDVCGGCFGQLLWAQRRLAHEPALVERTVALHARLLARMADACADADVAFLAVLLPTSAEVAGLDDVTVAQAERLGIPGDPVEHVTAWRDALLAEVPGHVPLFDLTDTLRAARDDDTPLYFPFDRHPTPRGQRVVADAVAELVELAAWFE